MKLKDDFLEYDFSPKSLKFIPEANEELLKPIKTEYAPINETSDPSFLQVILDENFFNMGF